MRGGKQGEWKSSNSTASQFSWLSHVLVTLYKLLTFSKPQSTRLWKRDNDNHFKGLFWKLHYFFKCLFIFEKGRERETDRAWAGEGSKRGTEDPKQALCWQQRAQCRAWTHKPQDHDLSWSQMLNQLNHPGTSHYLLNTGGEIQVPYHRSWHIVDTQFNFAYSPLLFCFRYSQCLLWERAWENKGRENIHSLALWVVCPRGQSQRPENPEILD